MLTALALVCTLTLSVPVIQTPKQTEITLPSTLFAAPIPSSRCFTIDNEWARYHDRICLLAFLRTMETRVLETLPVMQGDAANEATTLAHAHVVHEVVADLERRVGEQPEGTPLTNGFVDEILLMADVMGSQDNAFSILYDEFIKRGYDAHTVQSQMQYDGPDPSGIPTFDTGELAPLLEGDAHEHDFDHLKNAATFQELTNPFKCKPGDERDECTKPFPIVDPRFSEFERWQDHPTPFYSHQPLDDALRDRARLDQRETDAKAKAGSESPFAPALSLAGSAAVVPHVHRNVDPVLQAFQSTPLELMGFSHVGKEKTH